MPNIMDETQAPWKNMEALLLSNDPEKIIDFLESLPPIEVARSISNLDVSDQVRLLEETSGIHQSAR